MDTLLILLQLILFANGGKVVELGNGNHAITGKGCGITKPLKYLFEIPKDPENHECVIIQPSNKKVIKSTSKINDSRKDYEYYVQHGFSLVHD